MVRDKLLTVVKSDVLRKAKPGESPERRALDWTQQSVNHWNGFWPASEVVDDG